MLLAQQTKRARHAPPLQEQLLILTALLLLVRELLDLRDHKVNKVQPGLRVQQEQLALLAQQEPPGLPDHKVQLVLMEQTALMEVMVQPALKDQQVQRELQAQQELRVQQEQLVLTELTEQMAQPQPLLLARLRLGLLAVVQALPIAVLLLLLFLISRSREELQAQRDLKGLLDQMLLLQWGQLLSVQAVLRQELFVTTPRKTGLRATTVISG